jgi:hypothetical protein
MERLFGALVRLIDARHGEVYVYSNKKKLTICITFGIYSVLKLSGNIDRRFRPDFALMCAWLISPQSRQLCDVGHPAVIVGAQDIRRTWMLFGDPVMRVRSHMGAFSVLPEHELLLHCARTTMTSDAATEVITLIGKGIDWDDVLRLAFRHRLAPLLYWQLNAICPEAVPRFVLDRLRDLYHANARRNVSLTLRLLKILAIFDSHGVPVLSYKGPSLAATNYGNLALCQFDDFDLLVHRRDLPRAKKLLISLGYQPHPPLTYAQEAALLNASCERLFCHHGECVFIDLHWATTPAYLSSSRQAEALWTRLERIVIGDVTIPTLSSEDLLLTLCEHGAKHSWARLSWIRDMAGLIDRGTSLDWPWILDQAHTSGRRRMLFLGLVLARDILGAPVPKTILPRVQVDPVVTALAIQVRLHLFQDASRPSGTLKEAIFYLRAMDRWTERGRYCLAQMMISTPGDWALLPLPRPLFPLYCVLRPIRLIAKYGRILFGGL